MRFEPAGSPHLVARNSVARMMYQVLVALVPAYAVLVWLYGTGPLFNLAVAAVAALGAEAAMLVARRRPVAATLADGSALVTAALLAVALPPSLPWWLPAVGAVFAIVVAKQLFGGLGHNTFNPAMAGYVVLLVSFPVEMTRWPAPSTLLGFDALSGATPLDTLRTGIERGVPVEELISGPLFSATAGWHWLALAVFAGGCWLLWLRVIRWPIPATVLAGVLAPALLFWLYDPTRFASPMFHLVGGATLLCAFFIATDPVSAATTPRGRIVYGLGIGVLVWVIRTFGGYPDAVAFAVLLMNMAAPALDHFLRPRDA